MPRPRPPYLLRERTRRGKTVWYVRIGDGPRTRIKGEYGSREFMANYHKAVDRQPKQTSDNLLRWLWDSYRQSPAWLKLSLDVRKQRERIMLPVFEKVGDEPLSNFARKSIVRSA